MSRVRLGRGAYWILGWLLTIVIIYAGTQYLRSRGLAAPVVAGPAAIAVGAVLCGVGLTLARRYAHSWAGLVVAGLGILSVGLGLANLVR